MNRQQAFVGQLFGNTGSGNSGGNESSNNASKNILLNNSRVSVPYNVNFANTTQLGNGIKQTTASDTAIVKCEEHNLGDERIVPVFAGVNGGASPYPVLVFEGGTLNAGQKVVFGAFAKNSKRITATFKRDASDGGSFNVATPTAGKWIVMAGTANASSNWFFYSGTDTYDWELCMPFIIPVSSDFSLFSTVTEVDLSDLLELGINPYPVGGGHQNQRSRLYTDFQPFSSSFYGRFYIPLPTGYNSTSSAISATIYDVKNINTSNGTETSDLSNWSIQAAILTQFQGYPYAYIIIVRNAAGSYTAKWTADITYEITHY